MEHILSLSYGKDSLACLGAIEELGWQLDRIVHIEVWATDMIPADLPQMVEFKKKADQVIKERYGIEVEHIRSKYTYNDCFYMVCGENRREAKSKYAGKIYGFPFRQGQWCNSRLKQHVLEKLSKGTVQYIGIACDEPERFHNLTETKNHLWWLLDGQRICVVGGAKKMDFLVLFIKIIQEEVAGSAITKVLDSFGFYEKHTRNYGI